MARRSRGKTFVWSPGMFVAYEEWTPGHSVMDTGFQLLTTCGRRVTAYGASVDQSMWVPIDRLGCFECRPSPMAEWSIAPEAP